MTIAQRFERFAEANPMVYDTLVRLAREMRGKGMTKVSIDFIYQVARWEVIQATDDIEFKLNDHYRAFYARLIMALNPDLRDFFECRTSEADDWLDNPPSATMQRILARLP